MSALKLLLTALLILAISSPLMGAEREVTIAGGAPGVTLAGTLATPAEGVPLRGAVVLASGSGRQDRDETILGHKPFKTLSDSLTAAGWSVLRVADRGCDGSTGEFAKATLTDFVADNVAATRWLDSLYNNLPVGIIGHSEGGLIAIINSRQPEVDFIVTLAAPAWAGDSIIMSQTRALAVGTTGRWDKEELQRSLLAIARSPLSTPMARASILATLRHDIGQAASLPAVSQQLEQAADALLSPLYRQMLRYNPAADISQVDIPWLAVGGDRDTQVLPGNLSTIKELNPRAKTVLLPGLNHLFQESETGLPMEYPTAGPVMTSPLIDAIVDFLTSL